MTQAIAVDAPQDAHRRMVRRETLIGIVGNGVIAAVVVSLLYASRETIPVLGTDGAVFGFLPGTFMFTLGLTIGLTLTVRSRVRKGLVPPLGAGGASGWPAALPLPRNVLARAVMLGAIAEACLVPLTFGLLWLFAPRDWSFAAVLGANVGYFVLLATLVVPIVAWRALEDPV